ncbi:hypothetical protein VSDG_03846 [Cytospora chrysosperma]|uniref:F-box domain-containing protein n=1 Tax=Cytospora chrysosperma TaxID=252740 RepID=A0A423W7G8_CYTCH|nr:hypothetical protein VSDG_03846 [Valsa sordida]
MATKITKTSTLSRYNGFTNLPNEILEQIMLDVGSIDVLSLYRLLRTCKDLWNLWHDAPPTRPDGPISYPVALTTTDTQMSRLVDRAVDAGVLPAILLVLASRDFIKAQGPPPHTVSETDELHDEYNRKVLDHIHFCSSPQSHVLPSRLKWQTVHDIEVLYHTTLDLARRYFDFPKRGRWTSPQAGPMWAPQKNEIARVQRALCIHEYIRHMDGAISPGLERHLMTGFSHLEILQYCDISSWLEEVMFETFYAHVPSFTERKCCETVWADYCPVNYMMTLALSLSDMLQIRRAGERGAGSQEILQILDLETNLTRRNEYPMPRTPIPLQDMFTSELDDAHRVYGATDTRWYYISSSPGGLRPEDQYHDPDTGPRDLLRLKERRRQQGISTAVSGSIMFDRKRLLWLNGDELDG